MGMQTQEARPAGFMEDPGGRNRQTTPTLGSGKSVLGSTGAAVATPRGGLGATVPLSARISTRPVIEMEVEPPDPEVRRLKNLEAQFYPSKAAKDAAISGRWNFPRKVAIKKPPTGAMCLNADIAGAEEDPERRVPGFGLGAQKLFASTSVKLPISAYPIYVEMHGPHGELWSRLFRGTTTIGDMKKWIFEKIQVPDYAYELSYAEPGKVTLPDTLRLLTLDESLESRTHATIRAAKDKFTGVPGVHSVENPGTTDLYVRLKCMHSGNLLNTLAPSRKFKTFVSPKQAESMAEAMPETIASGKIAGSTAQSVRSQVLESTAIVERALDEPAYDPILEGCWIRPDENKHSYYHSIGYELFKSARERGGHAHIAKICINSRNYASRLDKPLRGVSGGEQLKASH